MSEQMKEGSQGNLYQEVPMDAHKTYDSVRADRKKAAEGGPDLDVAARAQAAVEAGSANPDHGKPAGAANALTFHNWDDNEDKEESNS